MIKISASDPDGDAVFITMSSRGNGDGDDYFVMFPDGRVVLIQPLLGKSGEVYEFNVKVSYFEQDISRMEYYHHSFNLGECSIVLSTTF